MYYYTVFTASQIQKLAKNTTVHHLRLQ